MRFAWRPAGSVLRAAAAPVPAIAFLLVAASLLGSASSPALVAAHARLRASVPASGATLGNPPDAITLTFSETPDPRLTSIKVVDSSGVAQDVGPVELIGDPADSVRAGLDGIGDGVYTVSWRTVSAVDGHISAGSFVFGVGQAPPTRPPDTPDVVAGTSESGSPPAIGARWILYLGLFGLIGAAWVALAVVRRPAPDLLALAAGSWLLTAIGTVGVIGVQWAEIGAPLETLPSTSVGVAALARLSSLGAVALALALLAAIPRFAGERGWALVGVSAALALVVDVGTGHAAAGAGWLPQVAAQAAHALAGAAWVGGLAALLIALRTSTPDERLAAARRFSSWAGIGLAVVAVTGAARAFAEIGTLDALFGTDFGRVVLVKSALLLALASLGAFNRFVTLKDAARVARLFRRVGTTEVAVAVAILACSALLVNLSPPASAGGPVTPQIQPIIATGHDFGTSVRARLVVAPGVAGLNSFDLAITDFDSGAPVDAALASLRFELVSDPSVAPSIHELRRTGPGLFSTNGPNLSVDGIWRVTARITGAGTAVEVPFVLATTIAPQPVQQLVTEGLPTIHTVDLGDAGSAQVYLDPGGPGPNELHVTFFDTQGVQVPVQPASIAVFPPGGDGAILAPRLLEPGHFVASVEVLAGQLVVDAVGPLPTGYPVRTGFVHVHLAIEVQP